MEPDMGESSSIPLIQRVTGMGGRTEAASDAQAAAASQGRTIFPCLLLHLVHQSQAGGGSSHLLLPLLLKNKLSRALLRAQNC